MLSTGNLKVYEPKLYICNIFFTMFNKLRPFVFLVTYAGIAWVPWMETSGATMAINTRIVSKCGAHTTPSHAPKGYFPNVFFVSSISSKTQTKTSFTVVKLNSFVRFL